MLKKAAFAVLVLSLAGGALAQEAEEERARKEPVQKIKVLENPYDIASFYRSSQGSSYFGLMSGDALAARYPIASYYRNHQTNQGGGGYGYSRFWQAGYGPGRGVTMGGYRRSIGENGDLFLFAPTFLAPVGPLSAAYFTR
jgi:hypothetical protein